MFYIYLQSAMVSIVEAMLPRSSSEKIGLMITVDLRENDFDEDVCSATILNFIFHRPSNYTKVLVSYEFNNFHKPDALYYNDKEIIYDKYSDHDSCWKSDGFHIFQEHWKNIEKHFGKHPKDISTYNSFSIFGNGIKYIKFDKFEPIRQDDGHIIKYKVKIKKMIPINKISKYLGE